MGARPPGGGNGAHAAGARPHLPPHRGRHPTRHGDSAPEWRGKIAVHNDPDTDPRKAWPWESLERLAAEVGPQRIALLGRQGPPLPGVLDLRGRTTLAQAAAVIREARCYLGVDSGLTWIAGSLQVAAVGLYGREYIPNPAAVQPQNPRARYLEADSIADLPPAAVLHALRTLVG